MHNDFTLFYRKFPTGKRVVYYFTYNDDGQRVGPWTTGQINKTAARVYCNRLYKEGKLIPGVNKKMTFKEFSKDFWNWDTSPYLMRRKTRRDLTKAYADGNRRLVDNQLNNYFGKMKLDKISSEIIEKWFDSLIEKGLRNSTINGYYTTLRTMLRWAAKKRIIYSDPTIYVEKLSNDRRKVRIITREELRVLFGNDWQRIWGNDRLRCTANKLAALTGMRCSEVLGLKGEYVFDSHIFLCAQYDNTYGYRETKTRIQHNIPLTEELISDLRELMKENGLGYVFSLDGGLKPVSGVHLLNGLKKALKNIGLSDTDISLRRLNFHAWRHFCNTELQKAGLTIQQVQAVTGHKSDQMTERYSHFDPMEFGELTKVQAFLLKGINESQH